MSEEKITVAENLFTEINNIIIEMDSLIKDFTANDQISSDNLIGFEIQYDRLSMKLSDEIKKLRKNFREIVFNH